MEAPFTLRVPIRFSHTDPAGIVYSPNHFDFCNAAVEDLYTRALGVDYAKLIFESHRATPIVRAECDFLAPSPGGVAPAVARELKGPVEFAFVDGEHSRDAVARDLDAIHAVATPDCVYLCHDVLSFDLRPPVADFAERHGLAHTILTRTPSGMALVHPDPAPPAPAPALRAFAGSEKLFWDWSRNPPG